MAHEPVEETVHLRSYVARVMRRLRYGPTAVSVSGWTCTDPLVLVWPPWTEITTQWRSIPLEMLRRMWKQTQLEAI